MLWFGKQPQYLTVEYTVPQPNGEKLVKKSMLLVDGFWGVLRHPQYIFELGIAFSWGLLSGISTRNGQSTLYFIFLTILLVHRAERDARKCKAKWIRHVCCKGAIQDIAVGLLDLTCRRC